MIGYAFIACAAIMAALGGFGWFQTQRLDAANNRADAAELKLDAAHKRATALALLWSAQVDKTEEASRRRKEEDREAIATLETRVAKLSRAPTLRYTDDAWRLWSDAIAAARDSTPPAAPAEPASGADPVPANAISEQADIEWKVKAAAAYKDAVRMFHELRDHYNGLRERTLKGETP